MLASGYKDHESTGSISVKVMNDKDRQLLWDAAGEADKHHRRCLLYSLDRQNLRNLHWNGGPVPAPVEEKIQEAEREERKAYLVLRALNDAYLTAYQTAYRERDRTVQNLNTFSPGSDS